MMFIYIYTTTDHVAQLAKLTTFACIHAKVVGCRYNYNVIDNNQ